jgi:hypothetical protein
VEPIATGLNAPRERQFAMDTNKLIDTLKSSLFAIDIQHPNTGVMARDHRNIGLRPVPPPTLDSHGITGGIMETVSCAGVLAGIPAAVCAATTTTGSVDRMERKDRQPVPRKR